MGEIGHVNSIYKSLRKKTYEIASRFPPPVFYTTFFREYSLSRQLFETDTTLADIKEFVEKQIEDDFGHGLEHSVKVAIDAGTLMIVEGRHSEYSDHYLDRRVVAVQCAGLLHDIKRKQKDHAIKGADYTRDILQTYAFSAEEVEDIALAIGNHEAFKKPIHIAGPEGELLSNCLYDADKFRWGPDNFTDTLWDMVSFYNPPISKFIHHYPKGMEGVVRIKDTFRTETGKKYGPQFIELGLAIGEELYEAIKTEFSHVL
jgi:hypothetical protein